MNAQEARQLMDALQKLLRPHLQRSEALREIAGLVGKWLVEQAKEAGGETENDDERAREVPATASPTPESPVPEVARSVVAPRPIVGPTQIATIRLGGAEAEVPVKSAPGGAFVDVPHDSEEDEAPPRAAPDLRLIERRSRLKAESCRLFIRRRAVAGDPTGESALLDEMNAMIARAKALPDCFLWVFWKHETQPADDALVRIARCYDALAEASDLVRRTLEKTDRAEVEGAMALMAEAHNMLRVALEETWLTKPDRDQEDAHVWLKWETKRRQVFIERYMRIEDRADPSHAPDLIARIRELREAHERAARRAREITNLFKRIRFHVRCVEEQPRQEHAHDFSKIVEAICALRAMGVPAADERFGEVLSENIAGAIGFGSDETVEEVLRRVRDRRTREDDGAGADVPREWSEDVRRVRAVLEGRRVVVVGGEPRMEAIARLRDAFGAEVEWVDLSEHGSGEPMRAPIARPETVLVLVIVRLTGHLHADEARAYARASGKPCVYLPAGYNPEQAAAAILEQAGERLGVAAGLRIVG